MNHLRILTGDPFRNPDIIKNIKVDPILSDPDIFIETITVELFSHLPAHRISAEGDVKVPVFFTVSQYPEKIPDQDIIANGIGFENQQFFPGLYGFGPEQQRHHGEQVDEKGDITEIDAGKQPLNLKTNGHNVSNFKRESP